VKMNDLKSIGRELKISDVKDRLGEKGTGDHRGDWHNILLTVDESHVSNQGLAHQPHPVAFRQVFPFRAGGVTLASITMTVPGWLIL
jgi:hypothetical protein